MKTKAKHATKLKTLESLKMIANVLNWVSEKGKTKNVKT